MSALPPKADIRPRDQDVCFGPKADIFREFLLDHLSSTGQQARRHGEPERLGGF